MNLNEIWQIEICGAKFNFVLHLSQSYSSYKNRPSQFPKETTDQTQGYLQMSHFVKVYKSNDMLNDSVFTVQV